MRPLPVFRPSFQRCSGSSGDRIPAPESGFRLPMPVLALGGARTEARGRAMEPLESLREIASDVRGFEIPECGHFIPEEQPALLADHLLRFFAR